MSEHQYQLPLLPYEPTGQNNNHDGHTYNDDDNNTHVLDDAVEPLQPHNTHSIHHLNHNDTDSQRDHLLHHDTHTDNDTVIDHHTVIDTDTNISHPEPPPLPPTSALSQQPPPSPTSHSNAPSPTNKSASPQQQQQRKHRKPRARGRAKQEPPANDPNTADLFVPTSTTTSQQSPVWVVFRLSRLHEGWAWCSQPGCGRWFTRNASTTSNLKLHIQLSHTELFYQLFPADPYTVQHTQPPTAGDTTDIGQQKQPQQLPQHHDTNSNDNTNNNNNGNDDTAADDGSGDGNQRPKADRRQRAGRPSVILSASVSSEQRNKKQLKRKRIKQQQQTDTDSAAGLGDTSNGAAGDGDDIGSPVMQFQAPASNTIHINPHILTNMMLQQHATVTNMIGMMQKFLAHIEPSFEWQLDGVHHQHIQQHHHHNGGVEHVHQQHEHNGHNGSHQLQPPERHDVHDEVDVSDQDAGGNDNGAQVMYGTATIPPLDNMLGYNHVTRSHTSSMFDTHIADLNDRQS